MTTSTQLFLFKALSDTASQGNLSISKPPLNSFHTFRKTTTFPTCIIPGFSFLVENTLIEIGSYVLCIFHMHSTFVVLNKHLIKECIMKTKPSTIEGNRH